MYAHVQKNAVESASVQQMTSAKLEIDYRFHNTSNQQ